MSRRRRVPEGTTSFALVLETGLTPTPEETLDTGAIRWAVLRDKISEHLAAFPEARTALFTALAKEVGVDPDTRIQI